MARSIVGVTIEAPGRDYGKTFRITERETEQTEAWLARALLALANAGVEIPAHLAAAGVSGLTHFDPTTLRCASRASPTSWCACGATHAGHDR